MNSSTSIKCNLHTTRIQSRYKQKFHLTQKKECNCERTSIIRKSVLTERHKADNWTKLYNFVCMKVVAHDYITVWNSEIYSHEYAMLVWVGKKAFSFILCVGLFAEKRARTQHNQRNQPSSMKLKSSACIGIYVLIVLRIVK